MTYFQPVLCSYLRHTLRYRAKIFTTASSLQPQHMLKISARSDVPRPRYIFEGGGGALRPPPLKKVSFRQKFRNGDKYMGRQPVSRSFRIKSFFSSNTFFLAGNCNKSSIFHEKPQFLGILFRFFLKTWFRRSISNTRTGRYKMKPNIFFCLKER